MREFGEERGERRAAAKRTMGEKIEIRLGEGRERPKGLGDRVDGRKIAKESQPRILVRTGRRVPGS